MVWIVQFSNCFTLSLKPVLGPRVSNVGGQQIPPTKVCACLGGVNVCLLICISLCLFKCVHVFVSVFVWCFWGEWACVCVYMWVCLYAWVSGRFWEPLHANSSAPAEPFQPHACSFGAAAETPTRAIRIDCETQRKGICSNVR